MLQKFITLFIGCLCFGAAVDAQRSNDFIPGETWVDTEGKPINAHHGCVLEYKGMFYWYGEKITREDAAASHVTYEGIACYESRDLLHWKNRGLIFSSMTADPGCHADCPRVIIQEPGNRLVMWLRITAHGKTGLGVLTANNPSAPFTIINIDTASFEEPGEFTVFKDKDRKAYLFYAAQGSLIHAMALTEDYMHIKGRPVSILNEKGRSAPMIFRLRNRYYLLTSASLPFSFGKAWYATSEHIMDNWKTVGSPFMGPGEASSYQSRGSCALPLKRSDVTFVYLADRWDMRYPERSTYVWLPMGVDEEGDLEIPWQKKWHFFN